MWYEGSIRVGDQIFHYWKKRFEEPSIYGIDGGRISKLMIKRGSEVVYNYDRDLDVAPADEVVEQALAVLLLDN